MYKIRHGVHLPPASTVCINNYETYPIRCKRNLIKIQYGNLIHIRNAEKCYRCALCFVLYHMIVKQKYYRMESMEFLICHFKDFLKYKISFRPEAKWPLCVLPLPERILLSDFFSVKII